MRLKTLNLLISSLIFVNATPGFAAKQVHLAKENLNILNTFSGEKRHALRGDASALKEIGQSTDNNNTLHLRLAQTYEGYPVWGSEAILHIPNGADAKGSANLVKVAQQEKGYMNGVLYQGIQKDLQDTPAFVFSDGQSQKALEVAIADYSSQFKILGDITQQKSQLLVYMDDNQKAHWAFYVGFYIEGKRPAAPRYIIDAITLKPYETWNEVKRLTALDNVEGGGFGGNTRIGKLIYDGLEGHLAKLKIQRDPAKKLCYLSNDGVAVVEFDTSSVVTFPCDAVNPEHNNVFWADALHTVNGGYSPDLDALYAGKIVVDLYREWYGISVLQKDNEPMLLELVVHSPNYDEETGEPDPDNALWNSITQKMYFGDGDFLFPLVTVGITAHEVSHGFTDQTSNLFYAKQSGAMNESFSDIAAQAAEFFVNEKPSWTIGSEVMPKDGQNIRFVDVPSKDCLGTRIPGERCSIDKISDYERYVRDHRYDTFPRTRYPEVHFGSGVFNRMFYVMANAPEWGEKREAFRKAFDVMVKANKDHWISFSTFEQGACGLLNAAKELKYDDAPIKAAMADVGLVIKNAC